VAVVVAIVVVC